MKNNPDQIACDFSSKVFYSFHQSDFLLLKVFYIANVMFINTVCDIKGL